MPDKILVVAQSITGRRQLFEIHGQAMRAAIRLIPCNLAANIWMALP
jgi:hypothetical protein